MLSYLASNFAGVQVVWEAFSSRLQLTGCGMLSEGASMQGQLELQGK